MKTRINLNVRILVFPPFFFFFFIYHASLGKSGIPFKIADAQSWMWRSGILLAKCIAGLTMFMLSLLFSNDRYIWPKRTSEQEVNLFKPSALARLNISRKYLLQKVKEIKIRTIWKRRKKWKKNINTSPKLIITVHGKVGFVGKKIKTKPKTNVSKVSIVMLQNIFQ